MNSDAPLDYAEFQLSPKRTRCELFVSSGTRTEKLASGLLKPFVVNLKVAEEQVASAAQSFKLEVGHSKYADSWFTKGTLKRFVRFVSSPDVFELVNTFDAEMSQLEADQKIYSQGTGGQPSGGGGSAVATPAAGDATKKELLRAIDLRLGVLQQDLSNACARAVAAGFNVDTVSDLQVFADRFRAHRLNEACSKFISMCDRRPNLTNLQKYGPDDQAVRSSFGSDMSIDDDEDPSLTPPPLQKPFTLPMRSALSRDSISEGDKRNDAFTINGTENKTSTPDPTESIPDSQPVRRLSVQDKISMFENKQKDHSGKSAATVTKPVGLRRLSSDLSTTMGAAAVLRRWSGVSDMSVDSSFEKKDTPESPLSNPSSSSSAALQEYNILNFNDDNRSKEGDNKLKSILAPGESDGSKDQLLGMAQSRSIVKDQENSEEKLRKLLGGKNESVVEFGDGEQLKILGGAQSQMELPNREDSIPKSVFAKQPNLKSAEESEVRIRAPFAARYKGVRENYPSGCQEVKSVFETEVVEKNKETQAGSEKASSGHVSGVEDSRPQRMKLSRQGSATQLDKKAKLQMTVVQDGFDSFTTPPDQFQKARQIKGNQELNDELKTKANQLEKFFDEHKKLRTTGDDPFNLSPQSSKTYQANKPIGSSKNKIKSNILKKTYSQDLYGDDLSKSFSMLSVSESSRGKLYDKYMKKRDAKLKEGWSSNRAEKEARLKSMQDSLERNRSEMNAKFLGSSASRRAERLRSYNSMPIINMKQQYLDMEDGLDEGVSFGDGISKTILPNNSNLTVPRSTSKTSMKRRTQVENPITHSIPNFSRTEKTKSSPLGSKTSSHSKLSNYGKEDKSLRLSTKSSANQSNSSDVVVLTPIKFNEEVQKSVPGMKTFPGKDINHASGFQTGNVLNKDDDVVSLPDEEFETTVKDTGVGEEMEAFDTFSRVDQALGSHMPVDISNPNEISDVWNYLHSSSQMEMEADADANAARTRKKWGSGQKPVLVVPHSLTNLVARKDTSSGFKRFLRFGKRNRGVSESLADWVSVTISEGDEDTEDGGDFENRSSEDVRKSRMGFSQGHPSNDNELFNEPAPRSFFSLSTFRSKGSESKPR